MLYFVAAPVGVAAVEYDEKPLKTSDMTQYIWVAWVTVQSV